MNNRPNNSWHCASTYIEASYTVLGNKIFGLHIHCSHWNVNYPFKL